MTRNGSVTEEIASWQELPRQPDLTEDERRMLRDMCQPGAPLWKVLKSAFDFAQHMRDYVAEIPLVSPEQVALARQHQLRREAALNFLKWVAECTQQQPKKDSHHGE